MRERILKVVFYVFLLSVFFLTVRSFSRILTTKAPDFSVLFVASKGLLAKDNPYQIRNLFTGVGYPPNTLLFYLPFTVLPYFSAQNTFTVISLLSLFGIIYFSLKLIDKKHKWQEFTLFSALALISFPTKFSFGMGQNNLIVFLLLLFSYIFYKRDKNIWAGILSGISISLKPVLGFLMLFFLLKRKWKLIIAVAVTVVLFIVISGFISSFDLYKYYVTTVIPPLLQPAGKEIYYNQGIIGFISRITSNLILRSYLSYLISFVVVVYTLWLTCKKADENMQFSLFITTLLLIDKLSWQHHFVWLIFPFLVLAKKANLKEALLLFLAYLLFAWNFKNPEAVPILLRSNQFYSIIILYYLLASKIQRKTTS